MTTPVTSSRRSFIWKLGAGASAAAASTAGAASERPPGDSTALRLAMLEEQQALRQFHRTFVHSMDNGLHREVAGLFTDEGRVLFNGGVFRGSQGIRRLYEEHFASGRTGVSMEAAPGFELPAHLQQDMVTVSPDLRSAKAVFTYSIRVGMPFDSETSLAAMARVHGEGVRTWWEGGVYRVAYRRDAAGRWKIGHLEYDALSRADWRPGRSYARSIAAAPFATRFPQDEQGPDELV